MMENKLIYSNRGGSLEKDKKNLSSISLKSENHNDYRENFQGHTQPYQVEDPLYRQYKNNMLGSLNSNRNTQREQGKKVENETNVTEIVLPVKVKSDDKDDWVRELKIIMIVTFPTPSKQNIVINITDPQDPLFLYILEIGEQEFHFLKQELSLLIEFQHFPLKFFEMLDLCLKDSSNKENFSNHEGLLNKSFMQSSYISILHHNTAMNEALFIVQEITQFRQLSHLILRFKPASDSTLKKYLSTLVKDFKGKSENLTKENSRLNENLENCYRELKCFKEEISSIKSIHGSDVENIKLLNQKELNEMKEKFLEEMKTKMEQKEAERLAMQSESEEKISDLQSKVETLNRDKLLLEDLKIKLEASERDLTGKNSILSSELKVYKEEVDNLRSTTSNMNKSSMNQEKELTEYKIKNELLLKQIEEKEKNIHNLSQLVDNLTKQKSDIEDTSKMIRNTNNKLEDKLQASIAEINKGNEIIQKLQADIKAQKEKMKLKQQSMKTQEQLITQKQNSIDDLLRNINDLKRENEKKEEEVKTMKIAIDNYKLKMEEAEKVCEDNAKVIRFLNQKLNESYQPYRNIMKTDAMPLSSLRNFKGDNRGDSNNNENEMETKKNIEYMNTGSSFNKQPYFNSLAFQSQGSFNNTGVGGMNTLNTYTNQNANANANINANVNGNNNQGNSNNYGFILPETNFSNFKSTINTNNNADTLKMVNKNQNQNIQNMQNQNQFTTGSTRSTNTNLLSHKYGNSSSKSQDYNYTIKQMNYEEEEEPRQAPINSNDKNIFQHKINY